MYCSKLWFTSVEMLCTICKCFWLLIFFYVQTCQVPTYMCVLYRYLNLLVDLLLKVLKHWMYIHVCTDLCECEDQFIFSQISRYMLYSLICNRSGTLYITKKTQLLWSATDKGVWFVIHLFVSDQFIYHLLFWTRWMKLSSFLA